MSDAPLDAELDNPDFRAGLSAGWHARDTEHATALAAAKVATRVAWATARKVLAERDAAYAVIEQVRVWNALLNGRPRYRECDEILAQSPADALAEHDRAVKADALEEAGYATRPKYRAVMLTGADTSGIFAANDALHGAADRLDHRAARYRQGGE